nr:DUF5667 domain-containing protein [Streptomyces sp. SID5468]
MDSTAGQEPTAEPEGGARTAEGSGEPGPRPGPRSGPGGRPDRSGPPPGRAAERAADPGQDRMVAVADALAQLPRPGLDPEVKTVQRAQLIAAMEAALADGTLDTSGRVPEQRDGESDRHRPRGLRPRSRWSRRLAAGGLTVGVAAGAFSGVAAASTDALPGDTLYGLKRGMEDLRLDMASDDADRGSVLLDMASTRLQEARRLLERGRSGPLDQDSVREVRRALSGMEREAAEGHSLLSGAYQRDGSLQPIQVLNAFSESHGVAWRRLRPQLPAQLSDVGAKVSSVFDAIEQDVAPLKGMLAAQPTEHPGRKTRPGHGSATGTGTPGHGDPGSRSASASDTPGHDKTARHGKGGATPSASDTSGDGLIGGSGLLNPPPGQPASPSGGDGKSQPDITVPPLLPGLLPGLGLGGDTDHGTK